ncbi:MAG: hypothetical protein BWX66_00028 [Deltaproteobacteria bacterium ADurb.Bin058]|nr:MAG: hypothetical protein BWX66_00028 [Deltaproteobacteria bacterium ADurb.Bin058]
MYRSRCLEATVAPLDLPHCSNVRLTSYLSEVGRLTASKLPYVAVDLTDIAKPSGKTMEGLGPGTVQAVADATVRGRGQGQGQGYKGGNSGSVTVLTRRKPRAMKPLLGARLSRLAERTSSGSKSNPPPR